VSSRSLRSVVAVVVVTLAASVVGPPVSPLHAQTLDDLDDAERVVEGFEDELDAATDAYEEVWAQIELARVELDDIRAREERYEQEARDARAAINRRARTTFMEGAGAAFEVLLASEGSRAAVQRAGMVSALQRREGVRIEDAVASRTQLDQIRALVADREAQLEAMEQELSARAAVLSDRLATAEDEAAEIRSLVSRQRRISRGSQDGIYACIFDHAFRFRDTWGDPRSGGRRHKGTDVFAPFDHPTFAITAGVIERHSNSRLGGLGLYLRGDDGNVYYYAHLNSIEPAGAVGNRVEPGELVARNGSSGNADRSAPHVHFELHPGGGAAINPYPWLAAACF
jgi:peptidoglycan LD-endopeptidase LytH